MANTTKTYYSVTETAQFVRNALKQSFPGVKFSVTSKSYSGGASINVKWTDGPTTKAVARITGIYEGASFDGSIDLKSYHDAVVMTDEGPKTVHYGADYIFENRRMSAAFLSRVYARVCRMYGLQPIQNAIRETSWGAELTNDAANVRAFDGNGRDCVSDLVHRMASKCVLSNGLLIELKESF